MDIATSFIKATATHAASGFKNVDEEELNYRRDICNACEYSKSGRCNVCGCYIQLKTKWITQRCPKNKWRKYNG